VFKRSDLAATMPTRIDANVAAMTNIVFNRSDPLESLAWVGSRELDTDLLASVADSSTKPAAPICK